ncbi:hypothetical protein BDZ89DRAFT_1109307 [Hymenopellis radicata]|nr:hypothetical protein BDZ89DRAFT_1109307 [Hymenopellis radicata]
MSSNHAMRDHVIEYSTCGPKAYNASDFGAANVRAVSVDAQGRPETGHSQGCFNCPGGGCTRRTPSRRMASPQAPTRWGTPFPVRSHSSAERETPPSRMRSATFSRGMKKKMAMNQGGLSKVVLSPDPDRAQEAGGATDIDSDEL